MSYQVLARKWRPTTFKELVGQDHVVQALRHGLDTDRLHHAYLFTGTRGVGKTTIARILARCLNCEQGVSSAPCGECSICQEVLGNRFMDLLELDAASRTGVDDTRDLIENAQYLPSRGRYKVYLIDEVHMLSKPAFNALLKTLEEPPAHVKFLLATTDPKKLPVTVLSRCLQFQLRNLPAATITAHLQRVLGEEAIDFEPAALEDIARAANGSMRDALSLSDQAVAHGAGAISAVAVAQMLGSAGRNEIDALIGCLAAGSAAELLELTNDLAERSVDFTDLLTALLADLHRQTVAVAVGSSEPALFDAETLQLNYQIALMGLRDQQIVPDPRLGFEMTLLRMLTFAPLPVDLAVAEPVAGGAAPEAERTGGPSPEPVSAGESAGAAIEAGAGSDQEILQINPSELRNWYDLAARLNVTGAARLLVDHALPLSMRPERFELALDADHDMLLTDNQVKVVERALAERLQTRVRLRIEPARFTQETPAARNERRRQARIAAAEQAIEADPTVRSLLAAFGGQVQQVRPLDD